MMDNCRSVVLPVSIRPHFSHSDSSMPILERYYGGLLPRQQKCQGDKHAEAFRRKRGRRPSLCPMFEFGKRGGGLEDSTSDAEDRQQHDRYPAELEDPFAAHRQQSSSSAMFNERAAAPPGLHGSNSTSTSTFCRRLSRASGIAQARHARSRHL